MSNWCLNYGSKKNYFGEGGFLSNLTQTNTTFAAPSAAAIAAVGATCLGPTETTGTAAGDVGVGGGAGCCCCHQSDAGHGFPRRTGGEISQTRGSAAR